MENWHQIGENWIFRGREKRGRRAKTREFDLKKMKEEKRGMKKEKEEETKRYKIEKGRNEGRIYCLFIAPIPDVPKV